jgi:hypothetical protein
MQPLPALRPMKTRGFPLMPRRERRSTYHILLRQPSEKYDFISLVTKHASHLHRANLRRTEKNKNVTPTFDHSDSCVRLRWLPHGTRARLLRRRKHQPHPYHRSHSDLAQSHQHLTAATHSSHPGGGVRRMGDQPAIASRLVASGLSLPGLSLRRPTHQRPQYSPDQLSSYRTPHRPSRTLHRSL